MLPAGGQQPNGWKRARLLARPPLLRVDNPFRWRTELRAAGRLEPTPRPVVLPNGAQLPTTENQDVRS